MVERREEQRLGQVVPADARALLAHLEHLEGRSPTFVVGGSTAEHPSGNECRGTEGQPRQSLNSAVYGWVIRRCCDPKSTRTAISLSASTPMARPRPYRSCVTLSPTANRLRGASARTLKGLVGRWRRTTGFVIHSSMQRKAQNRPRPNGPNPAGPEITTLTCRFGQWADAPPPRTGVAPGPQRMRQPRRTPHRRFRRPESAVRSPTTRQARVVGVPPATGPLRSMRGSCVPGAKFPTAAGCGLLSSP